MRPILVPAYIRECSQCNTGDVTEKIKKAYTSLQKGYPEVSIVIPAYNEEKNIIQTLYSLCHNRTSKSVEIIVVNNNSTDNTETLVLTTGVICIPETVRGITAARNAGLANAKGKYILNADADTIYPEDWIEEMINPLATDENIVSVYGRFAFIPVGDTGRLIYFFYEHFADTTRWLNKYLKDEVVNVYGFNSGFRRGQGLQVEGFNHPPGTNEDGWLALKLREKYLGKLHYVTTRKAMVWTSDRRILIDGGIWKAIGHRLRKMFLKTDRPLRSDL